jgi:hypothetical protein
MDVLYLFDHFEALTLKSLSKLWIGYNGTDLLVMSFVDFSYIVID